MKKIMDKCQLNTQITHVNANKLDKYIEETGYKISDVLNDLLNKYLDKYIEENKIEKRKGIKKALEDFEKETFGI
jgi:hypothetical protein